MFSKLKAKFIRLPFVKEVWKIAAAYALKGGNEFVDGGVPLGILYKQILRKMLYCLVLCVFIFLMHIIFGDGAISKELVKSVNDHIMSVFPDLLGFGIGVYAVVHVLPASHYQEVQKKFEDGRSTIRPTTINSELGYPLIAMCAVLLLAIIFEFFPENQFTFFINLFLLIYGMAMVFELVYSIFLFSQVHISNISKKD